MYRFVASLVLAVLLAGGAACTKVTFRPLNPASSYEPTSEVKMFRNFPDLPYEEIGTLRAVGGNKDKLLKNIRKQAMKIGAQALVIKPTAERSNEYVSRRQGPEFGKKEYIMEAVALRFKPANK
jgi:hypothetical protein